MWKGLQEKHFGLEYLKKIYCNNHQHIILELTVNINNSIINIFAATKKSTETFKMGVMGPIFTYLCFQVDPHKSWKENNFPRFGRVEGKGLHLEWSVKFVQFTGYTYSLKHHCSNGKCLKIMSA